MYKRQSLDILFTENKKPQTLQEYLLSLYKDPLITFNSIKGLFQNAIRNNKFNFKITKEDIRLFLLT